MVKHLEQHHRNESVMMKKLPAQICQYIRTPIRQDGHKYTRYDEYKCDYILLKEILGEILMIIDVTTRYTWYEMPKI